MQIQVNTDNNIQGREALTGHVETTIGNVLRHFQEHITRVEVHINDENSHKSGAQDKRCMMEARLQKHQPVAVSHHAETIHQAIDGASKKLKNALTATLGRLNRQP